MSRGRPKGSARMTDKKLKFIKAYLTNGYDLREAAKAAGYSDGSYGWLMKDKTIKKILEDLNLENVDHLKLTKELVLRQLFYCISREIDDFLDEEGKLITDLQKLPERAKASVDTIKQDVYVKKNGQQIIKTEVKLVPKLQAIELAMKHKGMFAAEQSEVTLRVDWDNLYERQKPKPNDIGVVSLGEDG